jgi:hypothetical protein
MHHHAAEDRHKVSVTARYSVTPTARCAARRCRGLCVLFNGASLLVDHSADTAVADVPIAPASRHDLLLGAPAADSRAHRDGHQGRSSTGEQYANKP